MHTHAKITGSLALGAALIATLPSLTAANITFDGGTSGTNRTWATASNWAGDVLPGASDDVFIGSGALGNGTTTIAGGNYMALSSTGSAYSITVRSVTFSNALNQFANGTLDLRNSSNTTAQPATLVLNTAGIDAISVVSGNVTVSSRSSSAQMTVNLSYNGASNFNVASGSTLSFNGASNNSAMLTGTGGINKTGSGVLALSGVSNDFTGGLTISGGTVDIDNPTRLGSSANVSTNALVIANGTVRLSANSGTFINNINRGTRVGNQTSAIEVTTAGVALRMQNSIRDISGQNGVLTKTGAGLLSLEGGTNSYTGGTVVSAGTLVVNGGIIGGNTSIAGVTVANGATLRGNATFNGNSVFATGSTVDVASFSGNAQANAVGSMVFNNGLTLGDTTLLFDLDGISTSDSISAASLDIGSGVFDLSNFSFTTLGGFGNGTYTLLSSATSIVGSFGAATSGTVGGLAASLVFGGGGTTVNLVIGSVTIPEPSSFACFAGLGALGLASLRRRKRG